MVIPVGPGHEHLGMQAIASAEHAWQQTRGPFTEMRVRPVFDPDGNLGRSRARNLGLEERADWHFLLDADDQMRKYAFSLVDVAQPATFGSVCLDGHTYRGNVHPVTRETLFERGAHGTLSMGLWVRGDLGLRFDEALDVAEDFDFYLRLPGFVKKREALVSIGYKNPSATGPRGYARIDWVGECNKVIARYRNAEEPR